MTERQAVRWMESALGVAAILGGVCVAALGERLRLRSLAWVLGGIGLCLLPCGAVFLVPASALARYAVLLGMFFLLQLGCSLFSTCAISLIQARTPERLMGKVCSPCPCAPSPWAKWCMGSSLTSSPRRCTGCCCPAGWRCGRWGWGPAISSKAWKKPDKKEALPQGKGFWRIYSFF